MNHFAEQAVDLDEDELMHAVPSASRSDASERPKTVEQSNKYRLPALMNMLRLADIAVLLAAGFGGYLLRFGFERSMQPADHLFIYLSTLVTMVSLHATQAYRIRQLTSLFGMLNSLCVGSAVALSFMLLCGYLSGTLHEYSRVWFTSSVLMSGALLVLNRVICVQAVRRASRAERLTETVVIVGATERAEKVIEAFLAGRGTDVKVLGVFDDRVQRELPNSLRPRMLGSTDALLQYVRRNRVDRVVVTLNWVASDRIYTLLKKLRTVPVRIDLVPSDVVWRFPTINMERIGSVPVLNIANGRVDDQIGALKRAEDLLISAMVLLMISPLLLLIALAIKLDSKGPVIFKQRRHGYNNEVFEVYKFRSMTVADSSSTKVVQATRNDMRVTKVGRFLRRSSLDELPQLFNVLFGHMSIVGPRPHAVQHNIEYGAIISEYFARHNVKPGITGWAQVSGLRGETDTVDKMHRRVEYDLHYIEHWSLGFDLKIILLTAIAVWFDPNAY